MTNPLSVEVLSLGYPRPHEKGCTKERWAEVFKEFSPQARYHAANLAAHNWDVLLIDGRAFLSAFYGFGGHWLGPDMTISDATTDEMAAIYEPGDKLPKRRLFAVVAADAPDTSSPPPTTQEEGEQS